MKPIKQLNIIFRTITNVEELIKNSLMSEMSTFRNLKIDEDSIEIKRQLDPEALQQAALIRDEVIKIKFKFHLSFKKIKKNS